MLLMMSFFEVEAFQPVLDFPEETYHLWRAHRQVRGLDRLNLDAMAFLWVQGSPPLLLIRFQAENLDYYLG